MNKKSINKRWSVSEKTISNIKFHVVWTTKYARNVLTKEITSLFKSSVDILCEENNWVIEKLIVTENYVDIIINCNPVDSASYVAAQIKSRTSHEIRNNYPNLWGQLPNLWTRSFFVETIGEIHNDMIIDYVKSQKWSKKKS